MLLFPWKAKRIVELTANIPVFWGDNLRDRFLFCLTWSADGELAYFGWLVAVEN